MKLGDFVGNERLVNRLRAASLPQASLFVGPEGVGKKTLALGLARLANCKHRQHGDVCGLCPSCLKSLANHHPDIQLVSPGDSSIGIECIRRLSREAHFRPFEGKLRFFILDQAEKMTEEAANSILKTLEEPPQTSKIVLVSALPSLLLDTVRSRCQSFSFRPLSRDQVCYHLMNRSGIDNPQQRANFSEGSIGRALSIDLGKMVEDRKQMLELLILWANGKSFSPLYERCEQPSLKGDLKKRDRVRCYLELLQTLCEDLYFLQIEMESRVVNQDCIDQLRPLCQGLTLEQLQDFLYDINQAKRQVEGYVNPLMSFETLWLRRLTEKHLWKS